MVQKPRRYYCKQCNNNCHKRKVSGQALMKLLLEIPNSGHIYDFEKDWFCGACERKIRQRDFHKLAVLKMTPYSSTETIQTDIVRSSGGMSCSTTTGQCLVCSVQTTQLIDLSRKTKEYGTPTVVSKQLDVIFILRNLLRLPLDKLEGYLREFGSPTEWKLVVCVDCQNVATIAKELHQIMANATNQLAKVQKKMLAKMRSLAICELDSENEAVGSYREGDSEGSSSERHLVIVKEVREFVSSHNSGPTVSSCHFIEGDSLAADLLAKRKTAAEDNIEALVKEEEESDSESAEVSNWEDADFGAESYQEDSVLDKNEQAPGLAADGVGDEDKNNSQNPSRDLDSCNVQEKQEVDDEYSLRKRHVPLSKNILSRKKTQEKTPAAKKTRKGKGPPIQCFLCAVALENDLDWGAHLAEVHEMDHLICPEDGCGRIFKGRNRVSLYRRHQLSHKKKSQLTCRTCGRVFNWRRNLLRHEKLSHTEKANNRLALRNSKEERRLRPRKCIICDLDFFGSKAFRQHNREVHGTGQNGVPPAEHKCRFCGVTRASHSTLNRHISVVHLHRETNNRVCHLCGFRCQNLSHLKLHVFKKHRDDPAAATWREEGNDIFQCPVKGCRKIFLLKGTFEKHMKDVHEKAKGVKPIACTFCGKGFFHRKNLARHELIHKNEGTSNYLCTLCGKSFSTPDYLYVHERYTCPQREQKDNERHEGNQRNPATE